MEGNEQLPALEEKIGNEIDNYKKRNRDNRIYALVFTIAPAFMSAIATVSIGVSEKLSVKWFLVIALIASGSATVLGAWEGLFSNRKMWVVAGRAQAELVDLKWDIEYRKKNATSVISQGEVDAFNGRFKEIIQKAENGWQTIIGRS